MNEPKLEILHTGAGMPWVRFTYANKRIAMHTETYSSKGNAERAVEDITEAMVAYLRSKGYEVTPPRKKMFETYKNWLVRVECTIMDTTVKWEAERQLVDGAIQRWSGEIMLQHRYPRFPLIEDVMELVKPEIEHYVEVLNRHYEARL